MTHPHDSPVRTRFAPSPTGRLHLGNVRTAVFNQLFARKHGGAFVLRIEDTDDARNVPGAEAAILEDLEWLGIAPDEAPDRGGPYAPYRQSERGAGYAAALERLLADGAAYPCFCADERGEGDADGTDAAADEPADPSEGVPARRYPGTCRDLDPAEARARVRAGERAVVRFRVPDGPDVEIQDEIRGSITFPRNDIDDFVLARSDGRPTYNFAVVVDDAAMRISHVIRGAGHLSNTPKQQLLFEALGHPVPRFAHLPTVLSPAGGKLSKRNGAAGVDELRARGVPPEAVVNYLSLLGWSHPDEREVLGPDELAAAITLDRVGVSDTRYDEEKFAWVAQQHVQAMPEDRFLAEARRFVDGERFPLSGAALDTALRAVRSRMSEFGRVNEYLGWVVPEESEAWDRLRDEVRSDPEARTVVATAARILRDVEPWDAAAIKAALRRVGEEAGVRGAALFVPVRKVVTADEHGPEIGALMEAAGREAVTARLARVSGGPEV